MNSVTMINRLPAPSAGDSRSVTASPQISDFAVPTAWQRLDELLPLIDFVPEAGPPVLFVLGPWLLVVLMLIGPFVLLLTLLLAAVIFVAFAAAVFVAPYLLVRGLRRHRPPHPARQVSPVRDETPSSTPTNRRHIEPNVTERTAPCFPPSFSSTGPSLSPRAGTASSTRCATPVIR